MILVLSGFKSRFHVTQGMLDLLLTSGSGAEMRVEDRMRLECVTPSLLTAFIISFLEVVLNSEFF